MESGIFKKKKNQFLVFDYTRFRQNEKSLILVSTEIHFYNYYLGTMYNTCVQSRNPP